MSLIAKIRRLSLEIALFLLLVIIGFAAIQSYRLGPLIQEERQAMDSSRKEFKVVQKTFQEAQKAVIEHDPSRNFFKVLDASKIRDEYTLLAEDVEPKARDLQQTLTELANQKLASEPGDAKSEELKKKIRDWKLSWDVRKNRMVKEKLAQRSQDLKNLVQKELSSKTNATNLITNDLGKWVEEIDLAFNDYILEAQAFRRIATSSPSRNSIQTHLALTENKFNSLLDLSKKIRNDADAIESFLKSNLSTEFDKQARIVAKAIELPLPSSPAVSPRLNFRWLFYALVLGSVSLVVLLFVVGYRSLAILPLREELAQRDAMIQRQDMLSHFGQLAAELAHEIRNPLTAINARLYTLQKSISTGTPEYTDASIIGNEISRLDRIVKDFLKVARPAEPKFISMNAEPLLKEVQELLKPEFEKQSIQLKCEVERDSTFRGDPQQLKQVLINLVQNAADSIQQDGMIILRARRDRIDFQGKTLKAILLEVEDNGPGVPAEVRERLFDPFFSTKKTGTGLGLAISARIIEKHFGLLNFESQSGRTIFRIALPIRRD